ncbi:hypothetical protein pdam_00013916 [Pocillopora damicornis]|uniref:Uncharacterized protein n=1 Tax=Pocillopora damicornis TaxID=46731 RepID=A0A3M6UBE2_POCDA|nr:hypothetical protein pdam_00013916 [Pocillopora damicornis]
MTQTWLKTQIAFISYVWYFGYANAVKRENSRVKAQLIIPKICNVMQHVRATILLSNTLAESTLPFHLCPDNDLMASCDQARPKFREDNISESMVKMLEHVQQLDNEEMPNACNVEDWLNLENELLTLPQMSDEEILATVVRDLTESQSVCSDEEGEGSDSASSSSGSSFIAPSSSSLSRPSWSTSPSSCSGTFSRFSIFSITSTPSTGVDSAAALPDSDESTALSWLTPALSTNDAVSVIASLHLVNSVAVVTSEFHPLASVCSFANWKKGGNPGIGDETTLPTLDVSSGSRLDCSLVDEPSPFARSVSSSAISR